MKKIFFVFLIVIMTAFFAGKRTESKGVSKERAFYFEERIVFPNISKNVKNLNIWVPYPITDKWQIASDFRIEGPFETEIFTDKKYGNKIVYLKAKEDADLKNTEVLVMFNVKRKENSISDIEPEKKKDLTVYLKPNKHVPVNDKLRKLAKTITYEKNTDWGKARAVYDYVMDELRYSKDDPQICGVGDTFVTLQSKRGNCSDYHTLFISLLRSLGIPAKFEIGFPIPSDKNEGKVGGYHCWAKFYIEEKGWIPVDISEADKYPELKEYFFGNINENRAHMVTGRDIKLEHSKDSQLLNFFIYPYAELDGVQFDNIEYQFSFKDLKKGGE